MRLLLGISVALVAVAVLAPTSAIAGMDGGGSSTPAPSPDRLRMTAAHHAARVVVRKFTRLSPKVSTMAMWGCDRRAKRRAACFAVARGRTATTRTVCHLRIAVRAPNRHPIGRLASSRCGTRSTLLLTAAQARDALLVRGTEVAGKPVTLVIFDRRRSSRFIGMVEWTRSAPRSPATEECFALMYATISPKGELHTSLLETGCEAAPTS